MGLREGMTLVLALICLEGSAWGAAQLTVKIESGEIAGVVQGDVVSFKGIPFAAAPTGSLRWREPQPPAHWAGVREPLTTVPACVQPVTGNRLPWTPEYMHQGTVSEDCLFLNVWKPNERPGYRFRCWSTSTVEVSTRGRSRFLSMTVRRWRARESSSSRSAIASVCWASWHTRN